MAYSPSGFTDCFQSVRFALIGGGLVPVCRSSCEITVHIGVLLHILVAGDLECWGLVILSFVASWYM